MLLLYLITLTIVTLKSSCVGVDTPTISLNVYYILKSIFIRLSKKVANTIQLFNALTV